jgi:hypothetical protein
LQKRTQVQWDIGAALGADDGAHVSTSPQAGISCKNLALDLSDNVRGDAHCGNNDDRSVGAFAVKPRAFGAPLCGIGA